MLDLKMCVFFYKPRSNCLYICEFSVLVFPGIGVTRYILQHSSQALFTPEDSRRNKIIKTT